MTGNKQVNIGEFVELLKKAEDSRLDNERLNRLMKGANNIGFDFERWLSVAMEVDNNLMVREKHTVSLVDFSNVFGISLENCQKWFQHFCDSILGDEKYSSQFDGYEIIIAKRKPSNAEKIDAIYKANSNIIMMIADIEEELKFLESQRENVGASDMEAYELNLKNHKIEIDHLRETIKGDLNELCILSK